MREDDIRLEAVASSASEAIPAMAYQIMDAVMARAIQADVARVHPLFSWIFMWDLPDYRGAPVARLVTDAPTP